MTSAAHCSIPPRARGIALLLATVAVVGCASSAEVMVRPNRVTIVAGSQATVMVQAHPYCETGTPVCLDTEGQVLEYVVQNLPSGVTYSVDTSLQSPSTPSPATITFAAAADIADENELSVLVHAVLDGRVLGTDWLELHVLPAAPRPLPAAMSVAAGGQFSIAVLADGGVASWGRNDLGQLGQGDRSRRMSPSIVAGMPRIVATAAGPTHMLALDETGEVWAWGDNSESQLGNANVGGQPAPARVEMLANIRAVAAGTFHSLALDADGAVWAWGNNLGGALGEGAPRRSRTPVHVAGVPPAQSVGAGFHTSIALARDGTVWSWGHALGTSGFSATPSQVAGLENIRAISVHSRGALALDADGRVWGWGDNDDGRLGTGTDGDQVVTPVRIEGPADVAAVALGPSLGLAVTAGGELWQWGRGPKPDPDPRTLMPRLVAGLQDVGAVAAGVDHALVALRCGQVWAWGDNGHSQLGVTSDRTPLDTAVRPVLVGGIGSDSGCGTVGLRILRTGDFPAGGSLSGSIAGSPWYGEPYTNILARGTSVAVSLETPVNDPDNQFGFVRWAGDCDGSAPQITIVLDRSKTCTAVYEKVSADPWFLLSVISNEGVVTSEPLGIPLGPRAINCGDTCAAIFLRNATVGLSATPASGFGFTGWGDDCTGTAQETTVLMDERKTCEARFRPFQLAVTTTGGGRVISEPEGIDCGSVCSVTPRVGEITLIAIPELGWRLGPWGGACTGSTPEVVVVMDRDRSCTATFVRISNTFLLTVIADGQGSVSSQPEGIACPGVCTALFDEGTRVVLTAQPAPGWEVSFWLEDCVAPGSPTRQVVMDADKSCRARITPRPAYPVARFVTSAPVSTARVGDVVVFDGLQSHMFDPATGLSDPAGIRSLAWDFDNDGLFDDAIGNRATAGITHHAFQAVGSFPVRLRVVGGPFDSDDVTERTITVLPAIRSVHALTVVKAGGGQGAIVTSPLGLLSCGETCTGVGPLLLEATVPITLVALPAPGSSFVEWSGSGCDGTAASIAVSMTEARTCTATFVPEHFPLTVNRSAGGSVASTPPGILCGIDCSESLPRATAAVLTALPDAGFALDHWSGCDIVASNQCTVAILGPRTVDVSFVPLSGPFTLTVLLSGPGAPLGRVYSVIPQGAIDCGVLVGTTCATTVSASTLLLIRPDDWTIENNRFDGWSGCDLVGSLFTCTVTMTSNRTIVATFKP